MTDTELEQLLDNLESDRVERKESAADAPFDVHPLRDADVADLDLDLFRESYLPAAVSPAVLAENARSPLEQMASLRLHVMTRVDVTSSDTERRHPDYPLPALQQIVRNAVMHRTYEGTNAPVRIYWFSDRIEIISPEGPSVR